MLSLVVLGGAGAVPVITIVGARWRALLLAPLAGAVLTAFAGACTLAIVGAIVPWFAALAVAAALASLAIGRRFPRVRLSRRREPVSIRRAGWAGAALVLAATAWSLRPLRVPSVGWDARAIWLLRASWFAGGHTFLSASFRDPTELLAHACYLPLISSAVAVSWGSRASIRIDWASSWSRCSMAAPPRRSAGLWWRRASRRRAERTPQRDALSCSPWAPRPDRS